MSLKLKNTDVRAILAKIGQDASPTNITGATNATPIVITATAHGLSTGDKVLVVNVGGNTAANGVWTVTRVDANSFSLNGSVGNSNYTSGGTESRLWADLTIDDLQNLNDAINFVPVPNPTVTVRTLLESNVNL